MRENRKRSYKEVNGFDFQFPVLESVELGLK